MGKEIEKLLEGKDAKPEIDLTKVAAPLKSISLDGQDSVEQAAFELFKHRSTGRANDAQIARQCFKSAETFAEALQKFRNGEFITNTEYQVMEDFTCPNQPNNHPHNLISADPLVGNINLVIEINTKLQADPSMKRYEPNNWDEPTTNIARTIFPVIVERFKKASLAASSN